jgi:hypothetical protein
MTILFSQINSKQEIPKEDFGETKPLKPVTLQKLLQWISIDSYLLSAIPLILIQPNDPENTVLIICERITLDFCFRQ